VLRLSHSARIVDLFVCFKYSFVNIFKPALKIATFFIPQRYLFSPSLYYFVPKYN